MPYIDGKRVTNEEWTARYGSLKQMFTGPNGENPAPSSEDVAAAAEEQAAKRPTRSPRSANKAKAAIADAMGVKPESTALDGIDVAGLAAADAPAGNDGEEAATEGADEGAEAES